MAENKWVTGVITLLIGVITVITPFITGRGPPCRNQYWVVSQVLPEKKDDSGGWICIPFIYLLNFG